MSFSRCARTKTRHCGKGRIGDIDQGQSAVYRLTVLNGSNVEVDRVPRQVVFCQHKIDDMNRLQMHFTDPCVEIRLFSSGLMRSAKRATCDLGRHTPTILTRVQSLRGESRKVCTTDA
jgi:hypothetical protein